MTESAAKRQVISGSHRFRIVEAQTRHLENGGLAERSRHADRVEAQPARTEAMEDIEIATGSDVTSDRARVGDLRAEVGRRLPDYALGCIPPVRRADAQNLIRRD